MAELEPTENAPSLRAGDGGSSRGLMAFIQDSSTERASTTPTSGSATPDPASPSPSSTLWDDTDLPPSFSRTYRDSSPAMEAAILGRSSVRWGNSGTGGPIGFSTLATSECRSDDDGCSSSRSTLSDILTPTAPQRFSLSARAAAGILRRASKRGRALPTDMETALSALSRQAPTQEATTGRTPTQDTSSDRSHPEQKAGEGSEETELTPSSSVRRLTPVECERLMGWPDGWTIARNWRGPSTAAGTMADFAPSQESTSSPLSASVDEPMELEAATTTRRSRSRTAA